MTGKNPAMFLQHIRYIIPIAPIVSMLFSINPYNPYNFHVILHYPHVTQGGS